MKLNTKSSAYALLLSCSFFTAQGALVAEFTFEEGTGTTAGDSSGNSLDGAISGGATWVAGYQGTALNLGGVDGTLRLADATFATNPTITSVSAWVLGGDNNPARTTFFWGAQNVDGTGRQMQVHLPWENGTTYWRAPSGQIAYNADASVVSGSWNHWAFTKDSTDGDIKIYLNGAEVASGTGAGTTSVAAAWIGSQAGNDRFYDGAIDELRIFDHELSLGEVQTLAGIVPEPSSALLALLGLGFGLRRRR